MKTNNLFNIRTLAIAFFLLWGLVANAQELTVDAPSSVETGQSFQVTYRVNAKAKDFKGPNFKGFSLESGPHQGSSSSFQWINGKSSSSVSYSFSYIVRADQAGTFTLGPASCVVDGKKLVSQSATIKVVKGSGRSNANSPRSNGMGATQQPMQQSQSNETSIDSKKLFARASVSNPNPYVGEEVIVTYKVLSHYQLTSLNPEKYPESKGFWSEDLTSNKPIELTQETHNGQQVFAAEFSRKALFPQESGKLTVTPYETNVVAVLPIRIRTLFGYMTQGQEQSKVVSTNSVSVNVKPLPASPDDFWGAVGKFSVKSELDNQEVKANEAITYSITINGHGNLMLIDAPELKFPKVFEAYEPKIYDDIHSNGGGVTGSRTFEWVLIPQSQGNYEIPAFTYSYFNPQTGKYVTEHLKGFSVKVLKGDRSSSRSDVAKLNDDINHIHTHLGTLRSQGRVVAPWQWIMIVLPVIVALVAILFGRKQQALEADELTMKQRRALKLARRRLRNAEKHLSDGNDNSFYEEIYKALWGCLSDKYSIPLAQLSRDTVNETLLQKGIQSDKLDLINSTLEEVDVARFAPGDSSAKKQAIYDKTLQTIANI